VFHEAGEPESMSRASSALLRSAFALERADLAKRRANAAALDSIASQASALGMTQLVDGSVPGYLRYAVRDLGGARRADHRLGIMQPYPRTLSEQEELRPVLIRGEPETPGAIELRRTLFTLPTHRFVTRGDLSALARWLREEKH
jgi:hypothetical protein